MPEILADATHMDTLTLHVEDLAGMESYYTSALALTPIEQGGGSVLLGRRGTGVIRLVHTPGLPRPARNQAGLFHTAMLLPDEATLAATVLAAAKDPRSRFAGSSDHHVSEAFYFTDPEGNGIELYRDRPRSGWTDADGTIVMTTVHLDPQAYLDAHLREDVVADLADRGGAVGHVHLQVGDLATARTFYADHLGFTPTVSDYPGALFVSAGGYHHHIGMNVWNSAGAPARAATLGLGEVTVTVPSRDDVEAAAARLRHHGHAVADDGRAITVADPWGSVVRLAPAA
ncbi:MAG TPA: glyoxalase [Micrococcales bacterium]|uniref:VOC family protein n=1 Tax=Miniimonas arenae TaxID=676201 RepID=A0A5C5BAU2_9MICO|nr:MULTISPECIES: VOC family protein [Miniimonas]TNU74082.1 VOC family protein [Miniimonas arenae]HCX86218.1 glyoxalase [Micrococcales bacterium]